ncbi:ABC transporter substrate-binding protein [Janthinobacterium sp. CG3]|nr:substrate-binding domain-containing protein [Janthinobacterium sp. CG3]
MGKYLLMLVACLAFGTGPVLASDKDMNIVFIAKSPDQEFWKFMRDGVERGIREEGHIALTWRGPTHNDKTDEQIKLLQMYTTAGVDAIIIAPTDRARLAGPVARAVATGIKVVVVDSELDGDRHLNFITTDNFAAGQLAAEHMSTLLNARGKVMVLRTVTGSGSTEERARGFIAYLKRNAPRIRVVADEYGGATRDQATRGSAKLLKKFPSVDGVFAVNESSTEGMLRALRELGVAGKKKFIGFDSTDFLLGGLALQDINGLVVQNPRQMGYLGIKAAVAAVRNAPVKDRIIFTGAVMVTPANHKNPEIQSLLLP